MTTEKYFYEVKSPIFKYTDEYQYHLLVGRNKIKKRFEGNFISGMGEFFYRKNFTDKTLNGLLKKIYIYRKHKS